MHLFHGGGNESGAITDVFRIKFVLGKRGNAVEAGEGEKKTGTIRWKDKEERERETASPDGTAALFPAITRPRNPEDIIISFAVSRYPPSLFPAYEFEGNAKLGSSYLFY